jgi:hypothetical protein
MVHQIQVRPPQPISLPSYLIYPLSHLSYIVAAGLDGGTQVISFILNFVSGLAFSLGVRWVVADHVYVIVPHQAVFGAAGNAHAFPSWWGNGVFVLFSRSDLG